MPTLVNMLQIKGTQASPVTNISLLGLKVTANRPSFMEPRANPSGGDWALERMGAILVEGTATSTLFLTSILFSPTNLPAAPHTPCDALFSHAAHAALLSVHVRLVLIGARSDVMPDSRRLRSWLGLDF